MTLSTQDLIIALMLLAVMVLYLVSLLKPNKQLPPVSRVSLLRSIGLKTIAAGLVLSLSGIIITHYVGHLDWSVVRY
jgi:hypothetical protein